MNANSTAESIGTSSNRSAGTSAPPPFSSAPRASRLAPRVRDRVAASNSVARSVALALANC